MSNSNEPWAAWTQNIEAMQKMLGSSAAINPFAGMFGAPSVGQSFDPQQFMKALDPEEIERRIRDLKAVETWMRLALQGVEMSIKTMEMQRDAYASFNQMSERMAPQTPAQDEADESRMSSPSVARTVKRAARGATKTARSRSK